MISSVLQRPLPGCCSTSGERRRDPRLQHWRQRRWSRGRWQRLDTPSPGGVEQLASSDPCLSLFFWMSLTKGQRCALPPRPQMISTSNNPWNLGWYLTVLNTERHPISNWTWQIYFTPKQFWFTHITTTNWSARPLSEILYDYALSVNSEWLEYVIVFIDLK